MTSSVLPVSLSIVAFCNSDNPADQLSSGPLEAKSDPWNRSEPRSLINIVPKVAAEHLILASQSRSDLFGVDERTLSKLLKEEKAPPTPTDNRLRIAFWMEYERSQASNQSMELAAVYSGVCTKGYFYQIYLACAPKVAWLVCQPSSYEKYADEAINFGLEQLRDVLEIPHVEYDKETGKAMNINLKLAELKAKIVFGLEARRKGAVVQRVEQKNMNLHVSATDRKVAEAAMNGTMEELEKRLADIRKRQAAARAEITDQTIDVESVVEESK